MPKVFPSQVVDYITNNYSEISNFHNNNITVNPKSVGYLSGLLMLLKGIPNELLTINGEDYTNFILATSSIQVALDKFSPGHNSFVSPIKKENVLSIVRDALRKCSDTSTNDETNELSFINDEALRKSIREDISSANSSFHEGEWKASTVLSGSVCEALLLWAVEQENKSFDTKGISLDTLLKKSKEMNIINKNKNEDTYDVVNKVRKYRNLIHSERAKRLGQRCNRATALLALSGVEMIINDLQIPD